MEKKQEKKEKKDAESIFDFLPGAEKGKVVTRFIVLNITKEK